MFEGCGKNVPLGVMIENGLKDWQILQQENGSASIELKGTWVLPTKDVEPVVYIRVVLEDTGDIVVDWKQCELIQCNKWRVVLNNIPTGGLYRIETCLLDKNEGSKSIDWAYRGDMVHHIGVGDIYAIAGQSNAAGYAKDTAFDPPELEIHLLRNNGKWDMATHPMNESTNTIHEVNCERYNPGHSPYLSFARMIKRNLGYPIGLVQAALGGSDISMWDPDEDGSLFRNAINIIKSQGKKITGILWYQGCTNANDNKCESYLKQYVNMIERFRYELNNPDLPFLTVQLNKNLIRRSSTIAGENADRCWGMIREAQRYVANSIKNVFIVPSIDCSMVDSIHNDASSNIVLGERLARTALTEIYGRSYLCRAPDILMAKRLEQNKIQLVFKNVYGTINSFGIDIEHSPFSIEDENGWAELADYSVYEKKSIIITLKRKLGIKGFVHGAYEMNPESVVPKDTCSYMPMLSFYNVEIN